MTMIPCPKCGQRLMQDNKTMCSDCAAAVEAELQARRSAGGRKTRAVVQLVVDMLAAFAPAFKPIWERTLAKPLTTLFVILVGWSILSGPSQDTSSSKPHSSSVSNAPSAPREIVFNSAWDGSVRQVENYLDRNLKDPDSFEAIEWSKVIDNGNGFVVRCKYRAKNSFGGYVIEEQVFVMNKRGDVISVADWGGP